MTLFGYGKTTSAIAKKFGNCKIYDDKFTQIEQFGSSALLPMSQFDPDSSDLEVATPGIAPHHPQVSRAKNLISEYDLFADLMPFSIWVSGTNGKTTTTAMIDHLLKHKGSVVGGNIGTPLADLDPKAPIWVLETSSFTLHYTTKAKPNIYLLLPITPDHISWHGSFEAYKEAKLKPIRSMYEGELIILPKEFRSHEIDAFAIYYENASDLAKEFDIDTTKVDFDGPFLMDAVMALAVTKALFNETDYDLINSFVVDPHKMQRIKDKQNRLWIDDSKATNYDAVLQALDPFKDKTIYLILGGDDKGADLTPLFNAIDKMDLTVFAIGSNREKIVKMCEDRGIEAHLCGFLDVAVSKIDKVHTAKSVAMLSPAAASLDQFASYKARGEEFQKLIGKLS